LYSKKKKKRDINNDLAILPSHDTGNNGEQKKQEKQELWRQLRKKKKWKKWKKNIKRAG